jgi:nucleotide-binding universal stress UspA family protein
MNLASSNAWSCRITMAGSARRGLPRAITRDSGAKVTFFCTEQRYPTSYLRVSAISGGAALRAFQSAEAAAAAVPDRCERLARAAGVACPPRPGGAGPYAAIIEAATRIGADVIFMASHGYRGVRALLLGSETQKVLTHSTIPVLVSR